MRIRGYATLSVAALFFSVGDLLQRTVVCPAARMLSKYGPTQAEKNPDGGGSYAHNGVRRWQNRNNPEWQTLAAWVRGEVTGSECSPVY